jgi:hypothetical protein
MTKRWLKALAALSALATWPGCGGARLPTRAAGETALTIRGQVKDGPYFLQRSDLAGLIRAGFSARAPGATAPARFEGASLRRLVSYRLQAIDEADTLVFVTRDGLAVPVSGALLKQYGPILADQVDGKPVPPQLAWPNQDQRGLDADPRADRWWTGPVEAIEVVAWDRTWGRALRPPPGVSDQGRLGAGQYLLRCAACHRLHGVGGQRGPALDGAIGRLGEPAFLLAVARHPGWPARLGVELAPGDEVGRQVAAFLAATDLAGVQPLDEPGSPPGPAGRERPGRF